MVQGLIDNHEILSHPVTIARSFGLLFYIRCLFDLLLNRKKHTFLDLVSSPDRKLPSKK